MISLIYNTLIAVLRGDTHVSEDKLKQYNRHCLKNNYKTQNLKVKGEGQQKILIVIVNLRAKYHILMMKYCLKMQSAKNIRKEFALIQIKGKQYW